MEKKLHGYSFSISFKKCYNLKYLKDNKSTQYSSLGSSLEQSFQFVEIISCYVDIQLLKVQHKKAPQITVSKIAS